MKLSMITVIILFCILTVGCEEDMHKDSNKHLINSQLLKSYNDIAIQNAIISQHTLFPYHFVKNGAKLNELGRRDLAALTSHFIKNPGHLNIRRKNTAADLYEARVKMVHERLQQAGIDLERISISDGMPGGSGMASERVLIILQQPSKGASATKSTSFSTGS